MTSIDHMFASQGGILNESQQFSSPTAHHSDGSNPHHKSKRITLCGGWLKRTNLGVNSINSLLQKSSTLFGMRRTFQGLKRTSPSVHSHSIHIPINIIQYRIYMGMIFSININQYSILHQYQSHFPIDMP